MALPPLVVLAELIPALMPTVRGGAVPVPRPPRGSPVPGSAATIGTSRLPFSPSVPRNGPTDRYMNGFMGPLANLGPGARVPSHPFLPGADRTDPGERAAPR